MNQTESEIQKEILQIAARMPLMKLWRQQAGQISVGRGWMHLAPKGAADITGYLTRSGRHVEVEVKDADGKQTKDQREWGRSVIKANGVYLLVRSRDEFLDRIGPFLDNPWLKQEATTDAST